MRVKQPPTKRPGFWRDNALTLVNVALFLLFWVGQFFTGMAAHNENLRLHDRPELTASEYLVSGHLIASTFENWESEFLQMAVFVLFSTTLHQRGSAESNPLPDERQEQRHFRRRFFVGHRVFRKVYENSLSIALFALFFVSFGLHLYGGWEEENLQRAISPRHEGPATFGEFFTSSEFWFQSFQNWQSEFLSVAAIVYLSVYLRQKGSAQSKPVDAPHSATNP